MTIKKLKEMIANLPDDMRVYADDAILLGHEPSEFCCIFISSREPRKALLQTTKDFDTVEETEAFLTYAMENDWNEQDAWMELSERGFKPEDFADPDYARAQFENYGLI